MTKKFEDDLAVLKTKLAILPTEWEGKATILEMKEANFQWRQMEWWAFYFEMLCFRLLEGDFKKGNIYRTVTFDLKRSVNWDLKAKAIKSDKHDAILNDKQAMEESVAEHGEHGAIIALCDVEYNDVDRSFQLWHTELKGGKSKYESQREARTSVSRYRKTHATLIEVLFVRFTAENLPLLGTMKQGRNSNSKPRPEKYMLDLEDLDEFLVDRLVFSAS